MIQNDCQNKGNSIPKLFAKSNLYAKEVQKSAHGFSNIFSDLWIKLFDKWTLAGDPYLKSKCPTEYRVDQNEQKRLAARELLKAALRIRGTSMAQVAREIGVSQPWMSLVVKGVYRSETVERALADALGTTPERLFSDFEKGGPSK